MIDPYQVRLGLRMLGVEVDDTMVVHSSYKSLGGVEGGPQATLQALRDAVARGTLLMPTFNFQFCTSGVYNLKTTPSTMGVLTELARAHPDACRTRHPIYNFAVLGRDARAYGAVGSWSACGPSSVFAWLRAVDAWVVIVGLDYYSSWTEAHHVEEHFQVDYRYYKTFPGVVDDGSTREEGAWGYYVRDWDRGVVTTLNGAGARLEQRGVVRQRKIGDAVVKAMRYREMFDVAAELLRAEPRPLFYDVVDPAVARGEATA